MPHGDLFVQDRTGAVYVLPPTGNQPLLRPGDDVEVDGVSRPSDFMSDVVNARIRVLSAGRRPPARKT